MVSNKLNDIHGFVLREFPYRESSKIIEIFTKDLGRISIYAKGVLRKNNRNLSTSLRFTKASYNLYKGKNDFYGIKESILLNSYSKSRKNFDIIIYKSAICDLLLRTIDTMQKEIVYRLIDSCFVAFESASDNYLNIFLGFLIKYLSFSGFKPNLINCSECGIRIKSEPLYFSIKEGGLICNACKSLVRDRLYLSKEEYLYIVKLLYTDSGDLEKLTYKIDKEKITKLIIDYTLDKLEINKFNSIDWVLDLVEK